LKYIKIFIGESSDTSDNDVAEFTTSKFIITLSAQEWGKIEPKEVQYKNNKNCRSYLVLPKGS